jgi:uncharacterized protein
MDLIKIKQVLYDEMFGKIDWRGEKSGKYYHGERVAELVLKLKRYIMPDDGGHDDILKVAAWFHDVTNGRENHALTGAERTKILLAEHCSEDEIKKIYEIIYKHDDRTSDRNEFSVYAKIQQDADWLDHFGTYDIWQAFIMSVKDGNNIIEQIEDMKKWQIEIETKYESLLNFDISKKVYKEKAKFRRNFLERFEVEAMGGIWNEKIIIGE